MKCCPPIVNLIGCCLVDKGLVQANKALRKKSSLLLVSLKDTNS